MAQLQQETMEADPVAQAFIVDRQAFWNRFTRFTLWTIVVVVLLLLGLWLFVA